MIESFLPTIPDLISLRDMMVDDSKRSTTKVSLFFINLRSKVFFKIDLE